MFWGLFGQCNKGSPARQFPAAQDARNHDRASLRFRGNARRRGEVYDQDSNAQEMLMARIVKRHRDHPYEVKVGGESQWICACGLSANLPYCDGSHKLAKGEAAGKLHWYDDDGKRHEAKEGYPDIRSDDE
jgi:CDGSH-type Zn-finger protein